MIWVIGVHAGADVLRGRQQYVAALSPHIEARPDAPRAVADLDPGRPSEIVVAPTRPRYDDGSFGQRAVLALESP
ncbi:MAG TPA: hypothetical protein VKE73_03765 [Myxococcota bacterium]|nr:hypothetical protein [Myxococcota bacterium]